MLKNHFQLLFWIIFLWLNPYFSMSQNIIARSDWRFRVDKALETIKQLEPGLYSAILSQSTIQAGQLSNINAEAFASQEDINGKKIQWILLDSSILNHWSRNRLAGTIFHEALHHKFWEKYRSLFQDEQSLKKEHEYIYNQELQFLKRLNALEEQIYLVQLMKEQGIKVYK